MIGFAIKHPILALVGVWLVNGAVRRVIANATGYDSLAIVLDALKAKSKANEAKEKVRP